MLLASNSVRVSLRHMVAGSQGQGGDNGCSTGHSYRPASNHMVECQGPPAQERACPPTFAASPTTTSAS